MEYIKTEDCIIEIEETIETDNERNELEKCVICLEIVNEPEDGYRFECQHKKYMHKECIEKLAKCPLCRGEMVRLVHKSKDKLSIFPQIIIFCFCGLFLFLILQSMMIFSLTRGSYRYSNSTDYNITQLMNNTDYD